MTDMQRSASGETSRAARSVDLANAHRAAGAAEIEREGKFSLLQSLEIARNVKIYGICGDGDLQTEIGTSRKDAGLASRVSASPPEPRGCDRAVRREGDAVIALGGRRGQSDSARPRPPARDRVARDRPCRRRPGAAPGARRRAAREAEDKVAGKWRRNGLKRLNPGREVVWPRKPRTHKIWYAAARPTVRHSD